ncbi:MAG: hypothetical protein ACTSVK_05835 [Promethearchaeota archaeon]
MPARSTVAVNLKTRQHLKKLSALLDLPQGEIIQKALEIYEKILFQKPSQIKQKSGNDEVQNILKKSLTQLWKQDPGRKNLDLKLMSDNEDFDESIIDDLPMEILN